MSTSISIPKSPIDWVFYTNYYSDLRGAGISTEEKALEHYRTHGSVEHRKTRLDLKAYLKSQDLYGDAWLSSLKHDSFYSITHYFYEYLIRQLSIPRSGQVLEVGCRTACYSLPMIKYLTTPVSSYHGTDTDQTYLAWCQKHLLGSFDLMPDETHLPYESGVFDLVYSICLPLIMSIDTLRDLVTEMSRVVKLGGRVVLVALLGNSLLPLPVGKCASKLRLVPATQTGMSGSSGRMSRIVNQYREQGWVHSDQVLQTVFDNNKLQVQEILYGGWSGTSKTPIYQDVIISVKI